MTWRECKASWPDIPGPGEDRQPCRFPDGHDGQHATGHGDRWGVGANPRERLLDVCDELFRAGHSAAGRSIVDALREALGTLDDPDEVRPTEDGRRAWAP